jgi:hypothetical protein
VKVLFMEQQLLWLLHSLHPLLPRQPDLSQRLMDVMTPLRGLSLGDASDARLLELLIEYGYLQLAVRQRQLPATVVARLQRVLEAASKVPPPGEGGA